MKSLLKHLFINHWPRKLVAVVAAIVIWLLVNHSITVTRTVPNVPIRVLNIPSTKTIEGVGPGGLLQRRIPITLTGRRRAIDQLTSKDLEVVTDAEGMGDRWTIEITKRNLISKNPDFKISQEVSNVVPIELTIQLSNLVTEKIPITIREPIGEAPAGFLYIGVWPQRLMQTVSGPEQKIRELKAKGLRLTFNLNEITEKELSSLYQEQQADEIHFPVPENWKAITLPFLQEKKEPIDDPEAASLHLTFLKSELLPLSDGVPVGVFFPLTYSLTLNPETYKLMAQGGVGTKNGLNILTTPVYSRNVSRLFLNTVQGQLEVTFSAIPKSISRTLPWSVQFIDPLRLEEEYLAAFMAQVSESAQSQPDLKVREDYVRMRFRRYLRTFELVRENGQPLELIGQLGKEGITVVEGNETHRNSKK